MDHVHIHCFLLPSLTMVQSLLQPASHGLPSSKPSPVSLHCAEHSKNVLWCQSVVVQALNRQVSRYVSNGWDCILFLLTSFIITSLAALNFLTNCSPNLLMKRVNIFGKDPLKEEYIWKLTPSNSASSPYQTKKREVSQCQNILVD